MTPDVRPPAHGRHRVRRAAALVTLILCAAFCLTQLAEVDLFWHLLAGRVILDEGRLPRIDDFTYTSAGRPWIDLHWLFQVMVESARRSGGWRALDALKVALITAGFASALLAALVRRRTAAVPALFLLAVVAAQERFTLRPEAASFCLLGLLLLLLARRESAPRSLYFVPPLFVLWANVHALFAVGVGLLALVTIGDALDHLRARRTGAPSPCTPEGIRRLLWIGGGSLLATLLTPYGLSGWTLPRTLLLERIATDNVLARSIAEFQAPFSGFGRTAEIAAFAALSVIVVGAVAVAWRSCRTADPLSLGAFLALALMARRNIALFALVALPAAAPALASARDRLAAGLSGPWPAAARLLVAIGPAVSVAVCALSAALLGDVVSNRFYARDGTQRYFGLGIAPGFYPAGAAEFVEARGLPGEVFNDLTMGGYLEWRFYPRRRLFIDGRLEVHDPALFSAYMAAQRDPDQFERLVERYGIRTVVWSHRHALDAAPLLRHLSGGRGWRPVYIDLAAAVFTKADGGEAGAGPDVSRIDPPDIARRLLEEAARAEAEARADDPLPAWARRAWPRVEVPAAEVGAALFLALSGRPAGAEPLLRDALRRAPWSADLHYDLGLVLSELDRPAEAREAFETALRIDPSLTEAAVARALLLLKAGDEEEALRQLTRAESRGTTLPAGARQARGALLARRGRMDEAIADYREAVRMEPERAAWRAELALLLAGHGLPQQARAESDRALALDPDGCLTRVAAARLRHAQGELAAAEEMLRAAGAGGAPCAPAHLELARLLLSAGRRGEARLAAAEALRLGMSQEALAADPALRGLLTGS